MNYIPGFSNYLQSTVPAYANGGRVNYSEPTMYDMEFGDYGIDPYAAQYMPAAQPMTQEAAAPYVEPYQSMPAAQPMTQEAAPFDLSSLAGLDLSGLNFGSDFGGGAMGGLYQADPNLQYIGAPTSNKGNATGKSAGNTFTITPDQPVRLVDLNTKTVIFEGTGADAARKATEIGQNLTDTMGRKASYDIQTADPTGTYVTVANEKKNKSTLGTIANIAGTALPLAAMFIPGLNVLGTIAAGAGLGGAGAAIKGDNILKGAALGGLSAAGGQILGPALEAGGKLGTALAPKLATAVGTGLGSTAGGLATGQNLKNSLIGGVLSGGLSYVSPDIAKGLGVGKSVNTSTGGGGGGGDIVVSGYAPTSIGYTLGGSPNKIQQALAEKPYDGITAIGNRFGNLSGFNFGGTQFGAPGEGPSALDKLTQPEPVEEILVDGTRVVRAAPVSVPVTGGLSPAPAVLPNDIVVDATKVQRPTSVSAPVTGALPTDIVVNAPKAVSKEDGLPEGSVVGGLPITGLPAMDPALTDGGKKLGVEEYLRIAALASGLIGGGGGGSGSSGTYGGSGTGRLNPIFSAKLPSAGGLGSIGMNRTQRPMGDVDWLTYGTRPELSFFDYAPRAASPTQVALPTPVTTPMPSNPAGPIMNQNDPMRFAKGGRSEFAVNGAGTGRSDDIPAVLSDGEYVIDAETVALLGDGSNKAGAKKLDELRVKVRKHKGKKLAKGRFSANAKKPEAYLSGGRI